MKPGTRVRHGTIWLSVAILAGASAVILNARSPAAPPGNGAKDQASSAAARSNKAGASDVIIHEWGTFLGMTSSDGTPLDGMYHEEHALPAFVHSRGRDQLVLPKSFMKGETPVIYFYTKNRQQVRVGVGFPQGIWTQWYPQARALAPSLAENAEHLERENGGRICWFAELNPPSTVKEEPGQARGAQHPSEVELPATSSEALWNYAREVDAVFVKTLDITQQPARPEFEKFLFYRGLSEARLPLHLDARHGGSLTLNREGANGAGVQHLFVLRVENGRGAFRYVPGLRPGEVVSNVIPELDRAQSMTDFTRALADDLASKLTESGLYAKEARAMVNTWKTSYFETEGVRVLFVLPQSWTDAFIPISVVPEPKQIVRVMVGRLELLTQKRELLAESAVRGLAAPDPAARQRAYQFLHAQGRYVEPIVRRVMRTTTDEGVRTLCRRLLLTELVTDLRAAVNNAADGKPRPCDPLLLRAHLARLLREIGLSAEAKTEAEALLDLVKKYPLPLGQTPHTSPDVLELRAAAFDALADDRKAATTFARRIKLRAEELALGIDPSLIPMLREWWVGRAYAQSIARAGRAGAAIAALTESLARSSPDGLSAGNADRSERMLLAFLLDGQGQSAAAEACWSSLATRPKLDSAGATTNTGDKDSKPTGL
jgi:hypothetical protein